MERVRDLSQKGCHKIYLEFLRTFYLIDTQKFILKPLYRITIIVIFGRSQKMANKRDYYEVLEINKNASDEEIKKSI